jgi:acyl-CoA hydrolase
MTPVDANVLGKVFGGAILAMIDLTASATAQKFAGRICVTASFDRVDFLQPIELGNLVTMIGHISYVGRTSMEVTIDVSATDLTQGIEKATNIARVTMVALGDNGKPVEVPRLICETRQDRLKFLEGRARRELRGRRIEEMGRVSAWLDQLKDEELMALVSQEVLLPSIPKS